VVAKPTLKGVRRKIMSNQKSTSLQGCGDIIQRKQNEKILNMVIPPDNRVCKVVHIYLKSADFNQAIKYWGYYNIVSYDGLSFNRENACV
jgi:hypothetical protein